ncbi:MAG: DNA/RNA nuclease SfsA [Hyphomicrobiales bacterium]|nr:DNA/RNA nuclease SfsA [Hyphomicrobiales bacterium]
MKFPSPLIRAILIKRYKRFLADVELEDGTMMTVHCPNPGSMMGLKEPGSIVWISKASNPKRKLSHTLELINLPTPNDTLVGVNTNQANAIAEEAIVSGLLPEFGAFDTLRREVKYGENSRIDILLSSQHNEQTFNTYIEVKSVTLQRQNGLHEFPDGVTERGRKHLHELSNVTNNGDRAIMLYLIQRNDGDKFSFASDIDPLYCDAFDNASAQGVEAFAIRCKISSKEIVAEKMVEIIKPVTGPKL